MTEPLTVPTFADTDAAERAHRLVMRAASEALKTGRSGRRARLLLAEQAQADESLRAGLIIFAILRAVKMAGRDMS